MKLPRYPKYKDSGVEWLGEVPEHWPVSRLKWSIKSTKNGVWGDDAQQNENDIPCVRVADFDRTTLTVRLENPTIRNVSASERVGRILSSGNLLLEKSGGGESQPVGCVVLYEHATLAVCSNFIARVETEPQMNSSFWRYVHAAAYSTRVTTRSINQTSGIQNLDQDRYFDELGPFPAYDEQIDIAAFLDKEMAKIDALVGDQQRLIDLLKEKRQAVISHAVTKGLNPNVPMKPSGIGWLGDVPAHWEVCRLATLYREINESGNDDLPILTVSIHDGVSDRQLADDELDRKVNRSEDGSKYKRVEPGDLVYNMMRAWQGGFGAVIVPGQISPAYIVARPKRQASSRFIEFLLRTPQAIEEVRCSSYGVADFRLRLYWEKFRDIRVALPPEEEQGRILNHIDRETARIDDLTSHATRAIDLLKERRSALISAAVTGKIDVRSLTGTEAA